MAMAQTDQDDEINLADIWATIKRYKQLTLVAPVLCGIAAYILVTFFIAPTWEASAILQVGQVGQVGQVAKQVESIPNVVSRMMQPSFAVKMLEQSNLKAGELAAAEAIYKSTLKVTKVKDTDLIEFKLRGYSAEMAQSLVENTVSYLQKLQNEMMVAGITRIKSQIQAVNEDLLTVKLDLDFLKRQLQGNRDWNSYNATLAASVLQDKTNQLRTLTESDRWA